MILDFLPYKIPEKPTKKIGWIRYIVFCLSLIFVLALFFAHIGKIERIMFWAFIAGNVLYYMIGIILAFVCKDNWAFCKYICPITVFLKPMQIPLHRITDSASNGSVFPVVTEHFSASSDHAFL